MDMQVDSLTLALWSALITLFNAGLVWLGNRIFKILDDIQKEHTKLKDDISRNYVRRDDYKEFQRQILASLDRIETKMDGKADK